MTDKRDIVVVGASFGGLAAAHSLLKHTLPSLKSARPSVAYRVVIIDQSSHFYWRIGAPRASVSTALLPHSQMFTSTVDGFKQYPAESWTFRQGTAQSIHTAARTITIKSASSGADETIPYYALILATGTSTPTPTTSLRGDHIESQAALDTMNKRLANAKEVVISGGGPVGVETAGEIGEALNGAAGWFKSRPEQKVKITLVTGSTKLLPILRQSISDKTEKFLNRVGVDVVYNARVEKLELSEADSVAAANSSAEKSEITTTASGDDKTRVHLSNGSVLSADVYFPAIGVLPNTSYVPKQLLDGKGYINTDSHLRVAEAGERVYCIGDAGNHGRGGVLNLYSSVPFLMANVAHDLESADAGTATTAEKEFKPDNTSETQLVPVGRSKGVGAFKGVQFPSTMVWMIKGRDFMIGNSKQITSGSKW